MVRQRAQENENMNFFKKITFKMVKCVGGWGTACNPCTWDVEAGISEVQGHPQLFRKWRSVCATLRTYLKEWRKKLVFFTLCWISPKTLLLQHCNKNKMVLRRNYVVLITVAPTADVSSLLLRVTEEEAWPREGSVAQRPWSQSPQSQGQLTATCNSGPGGPNDFFFDILRAPAHMDIHTDT